MNPLRADLDPRNTRWPKLPPTARVVTYPRDDFEQIAALTRGIFDHLYPGWDVWDHVGLETDT